MSSRSKRRQINSLQPIHRLMKQKRAKEAAVRRQSLKSLSPNTLTDEDGESELEDDHSDPAKKEIRK
jgi:hypothetical protein